MALVNVFYGMTILSFFTTFMFAIGGLCGSITDHPISRYCFSMAEDAGFTCLGFLALTVFGLLFV